MNPSQIPDSIKDQVHDHPFSLDDKCWVWKGDTTSGGAPIIRDNTGSVSAKLAFYHLLSGDPLDDLPEGKTYSFYMGACDNKLCVKPVLYEHMVYRVGNKRGPRGAKQNEKLRKMTPWSRGRTLRFVYGLDAPEEGFNQDLIKYEDRICELLNACLNHFSEDECIPWASLTSHYQEDSPYDPRDDFFDSRQNWAFKPKSKMSVRLPAKRALYIFYNTLEDYFLIDGIHRIDNTCKNKDCLAPWHLKSTVRTPGTRNAKTEWIS